MVSTVQVLPRVFLPVIFAPTELKVRAHMNTLNVTWQPSPNHTLASGYKLSYREADAAESAKTHTVRLRKKARYHLLTGMGKFQSLCKKALAVLPTLKLIFTFLLFCFVGVLSDFTLVESAVSKHAVKRKTVARIVSNNNLFFCGLC